MFIFNNQPLSPDVAFTDPATGVQYPANWLRLSSTEEREAIGITEVPDPEPYDQRFYWGPDLPKDHTQLVKQWVGQTKATAGSLLAGSDWYITRQVETSTATPAAVLARRAEIRTLSNTKEAAINATADTAELAAYITGPEYGVWEEAIEGGGE